MDSLIDLWQSGQSRIWLSSLSDTESLPEGPAIRYTKVFNVLVTIVLGRIRLCMSLLANDLPALALPGFFFVAFAPVSAFGFSDALAFKSLADSSFAGHFPASASTGGRFGAF